MPASLSPWLLDISVFGTASFAGALLLFVLERLASKRPDIAAQKREMELSRFQAPWSLAAVRRTSILLGTLIAVAIYVFLDNVVFAFFPFVVGLLFPVIYPVRVKSRYIRAFEEGFSECLDIWTRCLQAGLSLQQAIDAAASDMQGPAANEMRILSKEISLGDPDSALWHLLDRMPLPDVRYAVIGVITCRQTGGRISEVVAKIADAIRERAAQREKIRAITSMGRTEAYIMGALPYLILAMMYILDPVSVNLLFHHWIGIIGTIGAVMWEMIGLAIIWKIVNIEA